MKIVQLFFIFSLLATVQLCRSQIPSVDIQTLDGGSYSTSKINNNGKPIIIIFWETFCRPCITEFDNINENYADWKEETGVKLIAISLDDPRTVSKVLPMVNSKGWEFEFYIDQNRDLKRALGVSACPHTFLIDNNGKIAYQQQGYIVGQESDLYEKVKKLAKGEAIEE